MLKVRAAVKCMYFTVGLDTKQQGFNQEKKRLASSFNLRDLETSYHVG